MNLNSFSATELISLIDKREISSTEVINDVYSQIEKYENDIKAYTYIIDKKNLRKNTNNNNVFKGLPISIKDNICTKNIPTTCSSKMLKNFVPPYNATVVDKILSAGGILIGKTNLDEFAMGSSTENSAFFITRNPWDLSRVPGGSSGGSAAAISSDEAILALGSDTGGSIRQPASFCGVVGLKPTYGRVSRYGLIAFASSLDQIGTITKNVEDCALLLNVISGYDKRDSTSVNLTVPDFTKSLINDVKGIKIGIINELISEGIETEIKNSIMNSMKLLESLGAHIDYVSLKYLKYSLPTYYILAPAEASSNLGRYDGVQYGYRSEGKDDVIEMYINSRKEGFGSEVKRRIMIGTYVLTAGYYDAYYLKAQKVRNLILQDFNSAFKKFDVLVSPTSPTVAFKIGERINDPLKMYLSDICTIPVNMAGLPAISIPCGFSNDNLPIGLQIIGKPFDEETLLKVSFTFQTNSDYHLKKPKIKNKAGI